jgi:hypothetical protein
MGCERIAPNSEHARIRPGGLWNEILEASTRKTCLTHIEKNILSLKCYTVAVIRAADIEDGLISAAYQIVCRGFLICAKPWLWGI